MFGFAAFGSVSQDFYRSDWGLAFIPMGFYWIFFGFTGFYWVLSGLLRFDWVKLSFTGFGMGFEWVLLDFTGFFWV